MSQGKPRRDGPPRDDDPRIGKSDLDKLLHSDDSDLAREDPDSPGRTLKLPAVSLPGENPGGLDDATSTLRFPAVDLSGSENDLRPVPPRPLPPAPPRAPTGRAVQPPTAHATPTAPVPPRTPDDAPFDVLRTITFDDVLPIPPTKPAAPFPELARRDPRAPPPGPGTTSRRGRDGAVVDSTRPARGETVPEAGRGRTEPLESGRGRVAPIEPARGRGETVESGRGRVAPVEPTRGRTAPIEPPRADAGRAEGGRARGEPAFESTRARRAPVPPPPPPTATDAQRRPTDRLSRIEDALFAPPSPPTGKGPGDSTWSLAPDQLAAIIQGRDPGPLVDTGAAPPPQARTGESGRVNEGAKRREQPATLASPAVNPKDETVGAGTEPARLVELKRATESLRARRRREPRWPRFGQGPVTDSSDPGARLDPGELPKGSTLGPFQIESRVLEGAAFARYEAKDPDGESVLLEVTSVAPDFDSVDFVRSAQTLARIDHAGLAHVLDAGVERGCAFVASDAPRGRTLREHVLAARPRAERSARIGRDVALALAHAHTSARCHGSLGPDDVYLDDQLHPTILGLGRPRDPTRPRPLTATTAPEALGPEAAVDAMADVHALGAILFHLVALVPCREGDTEAALRTSIRAGPPPFLRDVTISCPPALEAIVARALAPRPERRYPSAAALAEDLGRFIAGARVEAPPIARGQRLQALAWTKLARHKVPFVVGAGALLGTLVAVAVFSKPSPSSQRIAQGVERVEALLVSEPKAAATELAQLLDLAAADPRVLAELPRVRTAVAAEETRRRSADRLAAAQKLGATAQMARDRAVHEHHDAEFAERDRRRLDPVPGGQRSEGSPWAAAENRRRRALVQGARELGEEWACLLLASALDPQADSRARFARLEREHLAELFDRGEPESLARALAAADPDSLPTPSVVEIDSSPSGATVVVERYVTDGPRLVARPFDPAHAADCPEPGRGPPLATPLTLELLPGSYRLRLTLAGHRETLFPVYIPGAGRAWQAKVPLLADGRVEAGWSFVPGGPSFLRGQGWIENVPPFLIEERAHALPGSALPEGHVTPDRAHTLAASAASSVHLPRPEELEKAFRGVDGRRFPWGDGFDPALAGVSESALAPAPSGSAAGDASPYGLRDAGGNLAVWAEREDTSTLRAGGGYLGVDPRDFEPRFVPWGTRDRAPDDTGVRFVKPVPR